MQIFSAYRRQNCRRDRSHWICPDIISIGITQRKRGYSGTAIFTKEEPIQVTYGISVEEHDHEGRVITAEYSEFYFVTVYVPNAQRIEETGLPHAVGSGFPGVSEEAGREKSR